MRDAADLLDLGAGHGLVVGDDGERLQRRARQAPLLDGLTLEQKGEIVGGAERPFAGDADEIDASTRIKPLQLFEQRHDVLPGSEMLFQRRLIQRLWRGEQQRLDDAQLLAAVGGRQRAQI